jgi:predicted phage terminase large subunit-like protein
VNVLAEDFAAKATAVLAQTEAEPLSHNLRQFVEKAWLVVWPNERLSLNWHIDAICHHLEAVTAGELRRLQVWVPPGSTKSTLVSIMWPAWEWTTQPWLRYITASYDADLATTFAVKSRELIRSEWYQQRWPNVQLKRDMDLKRSYANTAGGERLATSVGGQGTGKHGHRIVIDDPLNAKEITSDAALEAVAEWHDGTISTRFVDPRSSAEVIIQQRLDERDLAGHVLELSPNEWTVLCLPEEYEPAHPYAWQKDPRTEAGQLLWPERVGEDEHRVRVETLGAHRAAGQLQQRPAAREGAILKRAAWRYFPAVWLEDDGQQYLPRFTSVVQSWDTAFKDRTSSDYVVGGLWGQLGADLYLLALRRERMGLTATKQAMRDMTALVEQRWPRVPHRILIEKSANGVEIIEELKREIRGVTPVVASTSKVARAEAAEPALEAGNIYVPGMAAPESPSGYNEAMTPAFTQGLVEECVDGATLIVTRDGLKRADEIATGDQVLTHRGRFKSVLACSTRWADDRVTLRAKTLDPLVLTINHPVLAMAVSSTASVRRRPLRVDWKQVNNLQPRTFKITNRGAKEPTHEACDALTIPFLSDEEPVVEIDLRQWYAYPTERAHGRTFRTADNGTTVVINSVRSVPLIYTQKLDYAFGRLCGLYLAEGSYSAGRAQWSFHSRETSLHAEVTATISERLGLRTTPQSPGKSPNCTILSVSAPRLEAWFSTFGKGAAGKRIPWWAWEASPEFHRGMIDGWLDGDGCQRIGTTVSKHLAWGMRLLAMRLGIWATITTLPRAGTSSSIRDRLVYHRHDAYAVNCGERSKGIEIADDERVGLWLADLAPAEPGQVFNLTVAEDESYVTTGGTLHNCAVFPNGAFDDQVDMLTQAVNWTRNRNTAARVSAPGLDTRVPAVGVLAGIDSWDR